MIVNRTILVILGVVLLIGSAAAIDLTPSTIINSNPGWLIANDGTDQSTITVTALQTGSPPTSVTGANVTFSLDPASQDLGTISPAAPAVVQTGSDGKATAVFTTGTKSGTATIIATISYYDGVTPPVQVSTIQRIDHDTPQAASFENPAELPVGSVTRVNVTLVDRWGNRIDNKNIAETIRLIMDGDGGSGLQDGLNYVTQKTYSTDVEGNVSADLRISTTVRSNYIQMDPIGNIVVPPGTYIEGTAESKPYYIAQTPASPSSMLPADGSHAVEIYYTVTDKYDNPITGASVHYDSTDGRSGTAPTNTWGKIIISFGPKDTVGVYTLKAVPLGNTSAVCKGDPNAGTVGYCSQAIEYYNTDPVDLTFTANPQTMTSLDVKSSTRSILKARVIDKMGNPVIGQVVHFSLAAPTYPGGPYIVTADPSLSATSAPVGVGGYATIDFSPGAFAKATDAGYNPIATGQVLAAATWTNEAGTITKTRDVTLVWKNYPYISTSSLGDCGNSQVGDMINITIQLSGDGAAFGANPIDVVLALDRSGSMSGTDVSPSRLGAAKIAATTFVDSMNDLKDRVGLFSYSSASDVTRNAGLQRPFGPVKTAITTLTANGATATRLALKNAIEDLITNPNSDPKTVRAVILMTDGDWNNEGTPLAHGTGWPADNPDYTFSGSNLEPDNYRYYTGLGGTLTPYATSTCSVYSTTVCDQCASGYTAGTGSYTGQCQWTSGSGHNHAYYTPATKPSSCNTKHCNAFVMRNKCTNGEFTNQNLSIYAKNNNIRLYAISFAGTLNPTAVSGLTTMAVATGGFYEHAPDAAKLNEIYTKISGDLQETAGGDAQVDLDFGTVKINDNSTAYNLKDFMDYVFNNSHIPTQSSDSTYINKSNITKYGVYHQLISLTQDDTAAWNARTMAFNVGTIKLNETWSATFRLNLTQAGKIDLFGPDSSTISFTDYSTTPPSTQTGFIPSMQCMVKQSIVNTGFGSKTLRVDNLSFVEGASPDPNVWTIKWNTTYDGAKTVQEAILYRVTGDTHWTTVPGGLEFISTPVFEETNQHTLSTSDTSLWPPGKCFDIQIVAGAEDANAAMTNAIQKCKALPGGTIFIKLD